jgi:hypothetical protein
MREPGFSMLGMLAAIIVVGVLVGHLAQRLL